MPSDPVAKRETPSRYFSSYSYDCRHYALGSLASQTPFLKGILARLRPWLIRHIKSTSDTGSRRGKSAGRRLPTCESSFIFDYKPVKVPSMLVLYENYWAWRKFSKAM